MLLVRRIWNWCRRFRHRCGYGVHSPSDFFLITSVIYEELPYYAYKALKETLGAHVAQAGSLVTADRLRFDFSHFEAMTSEEIAKVEAAVNDAILSSMPIVVKELPLLEELL